MSLSRDTIGEIKTYIKENCAHLFGKKFWECRTILHTQISSKPDKYEPRFFVISKFRVFILHGKSPVHLKVDKKFNILTLRSIQVVSPTKELCLSWEDRSKGTIAKAFIKSEEKDTVDLARDLLAALKHYFPDIGPSLQNFCTVVPSKLVNEFSHLPESTPKLLCNNFRRSYVAICDYYDQRYKDEVVWDFEHIYFTHNLHEIRLEDFVHLSIKDQVTILACAQFSEYFTGISIDGTKLVNEHIEILFNIVRRSHSLKSLKLVNCNLPKDFITHFSSAVSANINIPLETIDFSLNNLDDRKGFQQLSVVLPKLHSLKTIIFANCGLSEKCTSSLASGLISGYTMENSGKKLEPKILILAGNPLKDDVSELVNFISVCTTLRVLDLNSTGILVDRLWNNLKLGGLQLEVLRLAGCSTGKKSKDYCNTVKELFSCMVNLREIDLSGTPIGPDLLGALLTGFNHNSQLKDVSVNLNGVCDKSCAPVLEKLIPECPIGSLSLRDCSLELEILPVLVSLRKLKSLTILDLGGSNFYSLKSNKKLASSYGDVLNEVVRLMNESSLQELNLSDCRIGEYVHVILNALGISKLSVLDISNNEIGNSGARLLSKALQLNHCLQKIFIDRNQVTAEGFVELANALKLNRTLQGLPMPMIDITEALGKPDRSRVLTAVNEIERYLERNRNQQSRNEELRQKVIHKLNNRSEKYEINFSDYKRIIFFELIKVISDFGCESPINVKTDDLIDSIVAKLQDLSHQNEEKMLNKLREALSNHNVEVCEQIDGQNPGQEEYLRKMVKQLVENHLTEMGWATVFMKADRLLSSNNALKLKGSLSNEAIDHSIVGFPKSNHRPASIIHDSTSPSRTISVDELNDSLSPQTPLVHLNKSRPRPARQLKNLVKDLNGNSAAPEFTPPPSTMNNSTTSQISSSSSSGTDSAGSPSHRRALLPPNSPQHLSSSVASDETPPPLPRRQFPPKLPPKPESPAKSPTHKFAALSVADRKLCTNESVVIKHAPEARNDRNAPAALDTKYCSHGVFSPGFCAQLLFFALISFGVWVFIMYALREVSHYGCPDALFDLSSTLYRVVDRMPISMKMAVLLDLQKIVNAYKNEPTMSNVLRNIKRFMDEELLPYVDCPVDKLSESSVPSSSDNFFASRYEDYMDELEDEYYDDNEYFTAREIVQMPLRKGSPLRFDKLSVVSEASLDESVFLDDDSSSDECAQWTVDDATYDQPAPSFVKDVTYDQPPSTLSEEEHPDDPKNSLNRTLLASSAPESDPFPSRHVLKKKKSFRNRITNLARRVTMTVRKRFGTL